MSNRPKRQVPQSRVKAEAASDRAPSRVVWIVLAVIVGVAAIVGLALAGAGSDGGEAGTAEVGFAEIIGDPLPPYDGEPDPAVGTPAPEIVATDVATGGSVTIDPDDGTVDMIGFFAHWCQHCQAELPRIVERVEEHPLPDGIEMVAIATAVDEGAPNYPPSAWFDREGWPYPVYADSETAALATGYGLTSYPYWVIVGPDGDVVARASGEMDDAQFADLIATAEGALP